MVGGLNKQIYLSAKLTERLGYFTDQGLTVQLSDEPAGVDAETAMLAGQVDGVVGFYDHTLDLQGKGKQTESVVQLQQAPGRSNCAAPTCPARSGRRPTGRAASWASPGWARR